MSKVRRTGSRRVKTPSGDVSVALDGPKDAPLLLFFACGAGGDMRSEFMSFITDGLAGNGLRVCRFNFTYQEKGRKSPDRQALLEDAYRAVVQIVQEDWDGPTALGGKSLGGRIASHVVAQDLATDALVFFGYPLHPPGRPDRLRDEHLYAIDVPMLFVEGTRDPFCPLQTLEEVRGRLSAPSELAVIDDGDHSFKVRRSSGRSTQDAWGEVIDVASEWLRKAVQR
jgi:predicted alpha/beta-hydrolase family hydrolase